MSLSQLQYVVSDLIAGGDDSVANHLSLSKQLPDYADKLPDYFRKIKVAFLSNFTLLGLPEVFRVRALAHNIWAETYLGSYNQYAQEILSAKSDLYRFQPQLVFFLIDSVSADRNQVNELVGVLQSRGIVVKLIWDDVIKNRFGDYWYTKYKELGDLRLAPAVFPKFTEEELMNEVVAVSGATKKCLVVDLDNTLWSGIIGEDGFDKIEPNRNLQEYILGLYKAGTILAINSRNNEEDIWPVIENHPTMVLRKNNFAAWQVNWRDKAENIRVLAEELNLGTDSFVFIDDDPFQRNLVKRVFPEVTVLAPEILDSYVGFSTLGITEEDKRRGQMYAEERTRRSLQSSLKNVDDFLKKLNLEVTIHEVKKDSLVIPRFSQMTQKTNQFNMTTKRWSEDDIRALLGPRWNYRMWAIEAVDRFGDYGIVGFLAVRPVMEDWWEIDNFFMSCRVLGRGIEKALLAGVVSAARDSGIKELHGRFVPTQKNRILCENFYPENGFSLFVDSKGNVGENFRIFRYDLSRNYPYPELIKVNKVNFV